MAGSPFLDRLMGLCYSRPRRPHSEREPLLPTVDRRDKLPPPQSQLDKAVDIAAAVSAGKLPSNDQLVRTLQYFLRFLQSEAVPGTTGPLSQSGRKLVKDVEDIVQATLQISTELNYDDKLQDLLFQTSNIQEGPFHVALEEVPGAGTSTTSEAAPSPPTTEELNRDVETLAKSARTLLRLLATSSAFRIIVADLLQAIRDTVDELAVDVERIALQTQIGAEEVRDISRLDDATLETLKGKLKEVAKEVTEIGEVTAERWAAVEPAQTTKDAIIGRVQEAIHRASYNPKYRSALQSILFIFRKYVEKARLATNVLSQTTDMDAIAVKPVFSVDDRAARALSDLKELMERAASGHSLDPFLNDLSAVTAGILTAPAEFGMELQLYFAKLANWFDLALSRPEYATSILGIRSAERLYDHGRVLFSTSGANRAQDIRRLMNDMDDFVQALRTNRTIVGFIGTLDAFFSDIVQFGHDATRSGFASRKIWREELWKDAIGWLVPKILRSLHAIPMPRVEFKNNMLDVAVDSLWLTTPSPATALVPDNLWIQNWSELRLDMSHMPLAQGQQSNGSTDSATVQSRTRTRIHLDGIRFSAHDIAYFFNYKGFVGYDDEGLLSIDVGGISEIGQGLCVDVDLEVVSEAHRLSPTDPLFRVLDVKVDLPGLRFSINKSKHWILNKTILQPFSGPVVKWVVAREMEKQIQQGLDAIGRLAGDVSDAADKRHQQHEGPTLEDYWVAFLEKAAPLFSSSTSEDSQEDAPLVTSHTEATLKGILHTTVKQPSPTSSKPGTPSETVIAVGGGAQIFPGKGGPYGENGLDSSSTATAMEHAVEVIVEKSGEATTAVKSKAVEARKELERAEVRKQARKRVERKKSGWRSHVFDL